MDKLGDQHIEFLRQCDGSPWKKRESDLPFDELQKMVDEGLIIKYTGTPAKYAITKIGSQVAKSFGSSPELIKIAVEFVISKGYTKEAAEQIVHEHGAEYILKSKSAEQQTSGQREIVVPRNEQGQPEIKYKG